MICQHGPLQKMVRWALWTESLSLRRSGPSHLPPRHHFHLFFLLFSCLFLAAVWSFPAAKHCGSHKLPNTRAHLCGHPAVAAAAAAARSPGAFLACDQSQRTTALFRAHHRLSILFCSPICLFVCFLRLLSIVRSLNTLSSFSSPFFLPIVALPCARG